MSNTNSLRKILTQSLFSFDQLKVSTLTNLPSTVPNFGVSRYNNDLVVPRALRPGPKEEVSARGTAGPRKTRNQR